MSDMLSQDEIEALLASLAEQQSVAPPPESATPAPNPNNPAPQMTLTGHSQRASRGAIAYEVYDFRRPDKFSKEQLRTLHMLHETFARHAGTSLSAFLRSPVSIELIALEQKPYEEYMRGINSSVFTIMSMPPLSGQSLLEVEFSIVFSMIDRLLGGPGGSISRNVLTDIERPLVRQMIERVFAALKTAWEGIVIINPGIETIETSSQFVQIAPPNDIVVTILFEVRVGNQRGAMSICIPYLLLKPITTKLSAQKWFVSGGKKNTASSRRLLAWQIGQSNVDCSVVLGKSKITMRDLLSLNPGDVLTLDRDQDEDLDFLVSKTPKFKGKPITSGKRLYFSITEATKQETLSA